jgi:hypothetical protein
MDTIHILIIILLLYLIFVKNNNYKETFQNEITQDQVNDLNLQIITFIEKLKNKEQYPKSKLLSDYKLINNVIDSYTHISSPDTYIQNQINNLNNIWNTQVTPFI